MAACVAGLLGGLLTMSQHVYMAATLIMVLAVEYLAAREVWKFTDLLAKYNRGETSPKSVDVVKRFVGALLLVIPVGLWAGFGLLLQILVARVTAHSMTPLCYTVGAWWPAVLMAVLLLAFTPSGLRTVAK